MMVKVPVGEPVNPGVALPGHDAAIDYGSSDAAVTAQRAACADGDRAAPRQGGRWMRKIADRQRASVDGRAPGIRIVGS